MKLKLHLKFAVAAIAALSSAGSFAVTTAWGSHDVVEVASQVLAPGAFSNTYTFSLGSTSSLLSTAVAANVAITVPYSLNILHVLGGTYSLWSTGANHAVGGGDDSSIASWAFSGTTGSSTHTVSNMVAGNYFYVVSGSADGMAGGQYTLASTVTAVPEPETYAMMLAGLGALGFLARRRRND